VNTEERKYRFSEIMSAVSMLPDLDMESDEVDEDTQTWVLPNLTKNLSDKRISEAILCQAFREDREFKFKLLALLCNSATQNINKCAEEETTPTSDDLHALAICANLLWGEGQVTSLYGLLGMIGQTCVRFDVKVPKLGQVFLMGNEGIDNFGKINPYDLIEGKVSRKDVEDKFSHNDSE
jgi:hypothetical protein